MRILEVSSNFTMLVGFCDRDVVALWAKPQKPVLQAQKTSSRKIESTRRSEHPSLVPAPANLASR